MSALGTAAGQGASSRPIGLVQQFDPRVRLITAAAFALVVVASKSLSTLAAALAVGLLAVVLARLPLKQTLRRLAGMDAFMLVVLLFLPFSVPGEPLLSIGPFTATTEGVYRAAVIVLAANAIVLALLALVGTIEPALLGHALFRLRAPARLVLLLLFTVRYIDVLHREYARLRTAMKARAFVARGGPHTWRSLGWLFGMLLVRSVERAERILEAMKCRGFDGRYHVIDECRYRPADLWFAAAAAVVMLALIAAEGLA